MNQLKETCIYDEVREESTGAENSNSENVEKIISIRKGIITKINIEELKEGNVDDKIHDNIGGGGDGYL